MGDVDQLAQAIARIESKLEALLAALDEDVADDYVQAMTLDGLPMPAERDQTKPL